MPDSDQKTRARLVNLEHEARHHPRKHALRLATLVVLGYAYPLVIFLLSIVLVACVLWLAPAAMRSEVIQMILVYIAVLIGAAALAAAVLSTFWVKLPSPDGQLLTSTDAPELRAMLAEVCHVAGAPVVAKVYVDESLNASVIQHPRFGPWGTRTDHLVIGLPLLMSLTPEQLRAVLAHEVAHLRGRHGRFGAWIFRVQQTWAALAAPFQSASATGRARVAKFGWLVMGWFVRWYGQHLTASSLALRRQHEYDADRLSGEISASARTAAETLVAIDWADYRLGRTFWPAVFREAGHESLPPPDVISRIRHVLASEPLPDELRRWRQREQRARTAVTSDHPCLADRLAALGCSGLLDDATDDRLPMARIDPEKSATHLLGDCLSRVTSACNISWKAQTIAYWRIIHAEAKQAREKLETAKTKPPSDDPSLPASEWEHIQFEAKYAPPNRASEILQVFLQAHPDHAAANFTLGRLLLEQDDDAHAAPLLEAAMRQSSEFIGPSLEMLLNHYRQQGRDADADPILQRLRQTERDFIAARKERFTVTRRDRFEPHDLSAADLEMVRKVVYRFAQIQCAYLVRKHVRLFTDKPCYVLAIRRRSSLLDETSRRRAEKFLAACLYGEIDLPIAVVFLGWTSPVLRGRILAACPSPIFESRD